MTSRSTRRTPLARVAGLAVAGVLAAVVLPAAPASADPSVTQLKHEANTLRARLDRLAIEQDLAVERYDAANEALMQATTGQVSAATDAIDSQRAAESSADDAAARVRAIYQSGGPIGLTATVLQSSSLDDALIRWHAVDDAVGAIVQQDADSTIRQVATARQHAVAARVAAGARAVTVARQLAADRAAVAVTASIARQRDLLADTDAKVVSLVEEQRRQAEQAALANAARSALALGLGGVTDASGHGLEGTSTARQQLPDVPAPNATAAAAVAAAATRLGLPYVWGATGPTSFDCSGLMVWSYAQAGVRLPRTSRAQYAALPHVSLGELAPGDLIFYATDVNRPATIHHVGMYIGDGLTLYAPQTGSNVKIGAVGYGRIIGAARPGLVR